MFILCTAIGCTAGQAARGSTYYWDTNGSTSGTGGDGVWDTATHNWTTDSTGSSATVPWLNDGTASAELAGGSKLTLGDGAKLKTNGITFDGSSGTIAAGNGSALSLTAAGIAVPASSTATITQALSGSVGLNKTGAGQLTLGGVNTYTTGTTVTAGTLQIANSAALAAAPVTVANGATIDVAGPHSLTNTIASLSGTGTSSVLHNGAMINSFMDTTATLGGDVNLAAAGTTVAGVGDITINGVVSNKSLIKDGTGTLTLAGANTYLGTTIFGGTLRLANAAALGRTTSFNSTTVGGTLDLNGLSLASGYNFSLNGGKVLNNGVATATVAGSFTLANNMEGFGGSADVVLTGAFTGTPISLYFAGPATVWLTTALPKANVTAITGGTLALDFSASAPSMILQAAAPVTVWTANMNLIGKTTGQTSQTINSLTLAAMGSISVNANGGGGTVLALPGITHNAGGTVDFTLPAGAQSGTNGITTGNTNGAGGILGGWATVGGNDWATVSGGNIMPLASYTPMPVSGGAAASNCTLGSSATLSGAITLNSLKLSDSGASQSLRLGSNNLSFANGAAGGLLYVGGTTGSYTIGQVGDTGAVSTSAGGEWIVNRKAGTTLTINAPITDNGSSSLTITGGGTLVLNGANTFAGGIRLEAGVLSVSSAANLGSAASPFTFVGGTLRVTGTSLTDIGSRTIHVLSQPDEFVAGQVSDMAIDVANANNTFSVPAPAESFAPFHLTKLGPGKLSTNFNLPVDGTTLAGGTLFIQGSAPQFPSQPLVVTGSSTLICGAQDAGAPIVILANQTLSITGNSSGTFAYPITGPGALNVIPNGSNNSSVYLDSFNTYTGGTTVKAHATLEVAYNGTLGDVGNALTLNGGTLDLFGTNQTVDALNGSSDGMVRNSANGDSTLTIGAAGGSGSFSGAIIQYFVGATSLVKAGAGTQVLSGSNSYTGSTSVNAGTLTIAASGSIAGTTIMIASGATFEVDGKLSAATTLTDGGSVIFGGNTPANNPTSATSSLNRTIASLNILTAAQATVAASTSAARPVVLTIAALAFDDVTSTLDLTNNELLTNTPATTVRGEIIAHEITSTSAGGTLGYRDLGTGQTEVRFTLAGDADLSGNVDVGDLGALATNYGVTTGASWSQGDFNYDGKVDVGDLGALATSYGSSPGGGAAAENTAIVADATTAVAASVPEPVGLVWFGVAITAMLARRRRHIARSARFR